MRKTHHFQISFDCEDSKEALAGHFIRLKNLFPGITVKDMEGNEVQVREKSRPEN